MAYFKPHALVITDCYTYSVKEAKELIKKTKEENPTNEGLFKRSDSSYLNEWAVHALCYRWNFRREKVKDADLEFIIEPEVHLMFNILGPIARLILKFYR